MKTCIHRTRIKQNLVEFIAVLFTIAPNWKQPKSPSIGECIGKLWDIYKMTCYSAIKNLPIHKMWMSLKHYMKARCKRLLIIWFHLCEIQKQTKYIFSNKNQEMIIGVGEGAGMIWNMHKRTLYVMMFYIFFSVVTAMCIQLSKHLDFYNQLKNEQSTSISEASFPNSIMIFSQCDLWALICSGLGPWLWNLSQKAHNPVSHWNSI